MACSTDRFTATFVVAPSLGPPDCRDADFTDIQTAINALPSNGGKVFVKAGTYVISQTIRVQQSNVHIQGEGMGITNIVAASTMTARSRDRSLQLTSWWRLAVARRHRKGRYFRYAKSGASGHVDPGRLRPTVLE